MRIADLMLEFAKRKWSHCTNATEGELLADDYRAAGLQDGPDIADAWQVCRGEWRKASAPRPGDFKMFLLAHPTRKSANIDGLRNHADMVINAPTIGAVRPELLEVFRENLDTMISNGWVTQEQADRWR